MKINFDTNLLLAGIGLVPWTRLGPERWLPNYKIASLYDWDMTGVPGVPEVVATTQADGTAPKLSRMASQQLLESPEFQKLLTTKLAGYQFMTYKPVKPPQALLDAGARFVFVNQELAQKLENKAQFRQLFSDMLPFPPFKIIARQSVTADEAGFAHLMAGRSVVVVQDEQLNGVRGTYIVRTAQELQHALTSIERLGGGTQLVVSDFIAGAYERTVQCCVTRYGVFVGPLQKQIIAHPLLANTQVADGDRFCGGEVSAHDQCADSYPVITAHAQAIGTKLAAMGYRGIFGVDCLVSEQGQVSVLEVNPRITGMTPLLTMLYREGQDIPFYLLHVLELAGVDYDITDAYVNPVPAEGSLLVLHSREVTTATIDHNLASGLYTPEGTFIQKQHRFTVDDTAPQVLAQQYTPPHFKIKPGGRLATVFTNGPVLDDHDKLRKPTEQLVTTLLDSITLRKVSS